MCFVHFQLLFETHNSVFGEFCATHGVGSGINDIGEVSAFHIYC